MLNFRLLLLILLIAFTAPAETGGAAKGNACGAGSGSGSDSADSPKSMPELDKDASIHLGYIELDSGKDGLPITLKWGGKYEQYGYDRVWYLTISNTITGGGPPRARILFFVDHLTGHFRFLGMIVSKEERGKGFAKMILKYFLTWAHEMGYAVDTVNQRKPLVNWMLTSLGFEPRSHRTPIFIDLEPPEDGHVHVFTERGSFKRRTIESQNLAIEDTMPSHAGETFIETEFYFPGTWAALLAVLAKIRGNAVFGHDKF